jgi:hypothetical protein
MSSKTIIIEIYNDAKKKGPDYISAILFVLLVASIYGYLYQNTQSKLLHMNLDDQKCNPRYLFFSGFLNPLYKDPWTTTQTNFNRCVATTMYKDPNLSREIKRNDKFIKLHDHEIKDNLKTGYEEVDELRAQWERVKELKDMDVQKLKSETGGIFEKQGYIHNTLAETTTQMFQVLKSTVIYIQGILLYRVSEHKLDLDINGTHTRFMTRYAATYQKYKQAFRSLDETKWTNAINTAREAIDEYDQLNYELNLYMEDHFYQLQDITESCYHLKYNLEDESCEKMFPKLTTQWIDFFPILQKILKGYNSK